MCLAVNLPAKIARDRLMQQAQRKRRSCKDTCWRSRTSGVPARIRYDNLKPAVVRVLRGRDRAESEPAVPDAGAMVRRQHRGRTGWLGWMFPALQEVRRHTTVGAWRRPGCLGKKRHWHR